MAGTEGGRWNGRIERKRIHPEIEQMQTSTMLRTLLAAAARQSSCSNMRETWIVEKRGLQEMLGVSEFRD